MKCYSCGRVNPQDASFCEGCGNQIRFAGPGELQPVRATPVRRKPRNPAFYLLISVIGLGIIALGVVVYMHDSGDGGSSDTGFFGVFNGFDDLVKDILWAILAWGLMIFGSILVIAGIIITLLAAAD